MGRWVGGSALPSGGARKGLLREFSSVLVKTEGQPKGWKGCIVFCRFPQMVPGSSWGRVIAWPRGTRYPPLPPPSCLSHPTSRLWLFLLGKSPLKTTGDFSLCGRKTRVGGAQTRNFRASLLERAHMLFALIPGVDRVVVGVLGFGVQGSNPRSAYEVVCVCVWGGFWGQPPFPSLTFFTGLWCG